MASIKQINLRLVGLALFLVGVLTFGSFAVARAVADSAAEPQPTAVELDNIAQNCATIKQSLTQLQYSDSRTRVYLGAAYETVANNFITPLRLRLTKNNLSNNTLFTIQSDFSAEQARFRAAYTDYMRNLESLLAIDCQASPQDFYAQLVTTRSRRATLRTSVVRLGKLIESESVAVQALKEDL